MKEYRIYYESLEQARHYFLPIVQDVVGDEVTIKLVKRLKSGERDDSGVIQAIETLTTPDILITGIIENKEYPLAIIEITEAVETEDHELQRVYGAVAAYMADCLYIKISSKKKSDKEFGGAEYNAYMTPKIFREKRDYKGYILAEWELEEEHESSLERDQTYFSCPKEMPIVKKVITEALKSFNVNGIKWYKKAVEELEKQEEYQEYLKKVEEAGSAKQLLENWKARRDSNKNKVRYFVDKEYVAAKINRFTHAMDPDRGILTFISFAYSTSHKIYGVYALVRPRGGDTLKNAMTNVKDLKEKFEAVRLKDKGGIPDWLFEKLKQKIGNITELVNEIDITDEIIAKRAEIKNNKVLITLFYFTDGIYLNYNGPKISWDRKRILDLNDEEVIPAIASKFGFNKVAAPMTLIKRTKDVDEDEVTYILVHKVLIPNHFELVSVSYPGAQGSIAVLPEPEKGKEQKRIYHDVIAAIDVDDEYRDVLINESKGIYNKEKIEEDIAKVVKYKYDEKIKKNLEQTLIKAKILDSNQKMRDIIISVSFGLDKNAKISWKPDAIDMTMIILSREKWKVGIFGDKLKNKIKILEGDTEFPELWQIK